MITVWYNKKVGVAIMLLEKLSAIADNIEIAEPKGAYTHSDRHLLAT